VLLYHAGVPLIPGGFVGVDVFFTIPGFLITTQFAGEFNRSGRIQLVRFYARRAKRLLPATAVVLVATTLLTWQFLPETRWAQAGHDIVASALPFGNWRFADQAVATSPTTTHPRSSTSGRWRWRSSPTWSGRC
jgi:peptidoglycan/LPS O-acetylase OafA/YrhL